MIKQFTNRYHWLSNFTSVKIVLDGITYPSVEHAYMSMKSDDEDWKRYCSDSKNSAGAVKRRGSKVPTRPDWEDMKVDIMKDCLVKKFTQEPFKSLLIETGDEHIQEGNLWGDRFWGVDLLTNKGKNVLGKLIMDIRYNLITNKQ